MTDTNDLRELAERDLVAFGKDMRRSLRQAANEIDRQAALIAKYEEAITKALSWLPTGSTRPIKEATSEAVKVLESALKGDSNQ